MKRKKIYEFLVLAAAGCCICTGSAAQQNPGPTNFVTLNALVAEALERNPELKFYEAELAAAKAGRRSAGLLANPQLSGSVGEKSIRDGGAGLSAEGIAWSVSVLQPFEWPGRIGLRKAIANRDVELAELGFQRFRPALNLSTGLVRNFSRNSLRSRTMRGASR